MTFNVDMGNGQIVEFPDEATARQYMTARQQQDTERFGESGSFERLAAQAGVGSQFGIANMLGLPVDAVATLVARRPGPAQDAQGRLAVPGSEPRESALHPPAATGHGGLGEARRPG